MTYEDKGYYSVCVLRFAPVQRLIRLEAPIMAHYSMIFVKYTADLKLVQQVFEQHKVLLYICHAVTVFVTGQQKNISLLSLCINTFGTLFLGIPIDIDITIYIYL
jgi:hypothetical protein